MADMTMTEAEFRAHLNDAFDSGSLAALEAMQGLIDGLRARTTPPAPESETEAERGDEACAD